MTEVAQAFDPEPLVNRATGLLRSLGLSPGDRLLTLLHNSPEEVLVVDHLARTPTGKVRRTGLAEELGYDAT